MPVLARRSPCSSALNIESPAGRIPQSQTAHVEIHPVHSRWRGVGRPFERRRRATVQGSFKRENGETEPSLQPGEASRLPFQVGVASDPALESGAKVHPLLTDSTSSLQRAHHFVCVFALLMLRNSLYAAVPKRPNRRARSARRSNLCFCLCCSVCVI